MSLLQVDQLSTEYSTRRGTLLALTDVGFSMEKGEALGLVGESGCGKTTLVRAILRLFPPNGRITGGRILFQDCDLTQIPEGDMRKIRFDKIALIAQSAMNALDPVYRVRDQITETILAHRKVTRRQAWSRAEELFVLVGLDPGRLAAYPHQLSGGMKQRAIIAMALSLDPELVIADEPTTALDVIVQDRILREMKSLHRKRGDSLIYVSHDISVIAETCDRVAVMYAGQIVELSDIRSFFLSPCHPYTMGLQKSFPTMTESPTELTSLPGYPPTLLSLPQGCSFAERCPFVQEVCTMKRPTLQTVKVRHLTACHFADQAETLRTAAADPETWTKAKERHSAANHIHPSFPSSSGKTAGTSNVTLKGDLKDESETIFDIVDLKKSYPLGAGLRAGIGRDKGFQLRAVDGISLKIYRGETLALAGESGCGKSTLGEMLVRLQEPTAGRVLFEGRDLLHLANEELRLFRKSVQMVFQDPYESLNPRLSVFDAVAEPLLVHEIGTPHEQYEHVLRTLEEVELRPAKEYIDRFPHELSGGQRQRVAIARAIVLKPTFVVADEPVSMLDVSVRAGILNLLRRLRSDLNLTLVYVSHDLATVKYLAHRIATMYLGKIVEVAPVQTLPGQALHPYTQALFAAVPIADPDRTRIPVPIRGELSSFPEQETACAFAPRCPYALDICHTVRPVLRQYGQAHDVSCHLYHQEDGMPHHIPLRLVGKQQLDPLSLGKES